MQATLLRPGIALLANAPAGTAITTTAERTVVTVTGELDLARTGHLASLLGEELELAPRALVIDLTGLTFCSARGLGVVLDAVSAARAAGVPVAVVAESRAVLRPVRVLGLEAELPLHRTLAEATGHHDL
ncbi:anti-anti-sigma factor [Amycolatopsis pretoriensis]|uniref:Anti-sigma factor antagonist n=1 Tax=Amycolatopsis pretoriensis TaxID=218821 RepID=A0A1H5RGC3_9PSEU|nr:STAS domain-containing protein [Amycolatopsis pretoriensis]SEF37436.1 anti-anti-sigma factor [Amycolatopsis pretoriensis]